MGASILIVPTTGNASTVGTTTNLISWWSCDETSGVRADDYASNDLTDNNTVTYATGKQGNACDFEYNNSEYLSIADASNGLDLTTDWTWSGWINFETTAPGSYWPLYEKWSEPTSRSISLAYNGTNIILYHSNNGTAQGNCTVSWSPTTATWYHLTITYTLASSDLHVYVNGSSIGEDTSGCFTSTYNSTADVNIARSNPGVANSYGDGLIDELTIWNDDIATTTILELYNSGNGYSYATWIATSTATTSTSTATTTTSTTDVSELIWVMELYLSVFMYLIFTYIGYRFTKLFI